MNGGGVCPNEKRIAWLRRLIAAWLDGRTEGETAEICHRPVIHGRRKPRLGRPRVVRASLESSARLPGPDATAVKAMFLRLALSHRRDPR